MRVRGCLCAVFVIASPHDALVYEKAQLVWLARRWCIAALCDIVFGGGLICDLWNTWFFEAFA